MHVTRYTAGLFVTAALVALTHWFPWPRRRNRIESYICGALAILIGLFVWLGWSEGWVSVAIFVLVAGAVAVAAHAYDAVMNAYQRAGFFRPEEGLAERRPEDA